MRRLQQVTARQFAVKWANDPISRDKCYVSPAEGGGRIVWASSSICSDSQPLHSRTRRGTRGREQEVWPLEIINDFFLKICSSGLLKGEEEGEREPQILLPGRVLVTLRAGSSPLRFVSRTRRGEWLGGVYGRREGPPTIIRLIETVPAAG